MELLMGLAGSLLVFTGLWHAFEWMMGGRNKDTLRLIPVGLIYLVLGVLIVTFRGGQTVLIIALIVVSIGLIGALWTRNSTQVRPWVTWLFVFIDAIIIIGLLLALLG